MSTEPTRITPERIEPEEGDGTKGLLGKVSLVVGAPEMGKSHQFESERFDAHPAISVERDIKQATDVDEDQFVIVDDFYRAYQQVDDPATLLDTLLGRERGVCIITRPWCLDWLLGQDDEEHPVTDRQLERFDKIYYIRYNKRVDTDAAAAQDVIAEIHGSQASNDQLDRLNYGSYRFRNTDHLYTYPATVAPGWADTLTLESEDSSRLPSLRAAKDRLETFGSQIGLSQALSRVEETAQDILLKGGISVGGLVGTSAFGIAGGIVVWLLLSDDGDIDSETAFDALLDIEMTPENKERIEQAYGLPPETVDALLELLRGDNRSKLVDLCKNPSEYGVDEERLLRIEARVEEIEQELQTLEAVIDIEGATMGVEQLGVELAGEEAKLLDRDPETTPRDTEGLRDSYEGAEPETVTENIRGDTDIVVLRGPHGTGKTTAAYVGCTRVQEEYDVVVPVFEGDNLSEIEYVLERSESPVVFTAFGGGQDYAFKRSETKRVLDWVEDGTIETLIVETRRSRIDRLKSTVRDVTEGAGYDSWSDRKPIRFSRMEEQELIENIVGRAFEILSHEPDETGVESVVETAEGNPEIAKIAARYVAEDRSLTEFDSAHELVWDDVQGITDVENSNCLELFEYLCAVRGMDTEDIWTLWGHRDSTELKQCGSLFHGYLGSEARAALREGGSLSDEVEWRVLPEIYADVVFRNRGMEFGEYQNTREDEVEEIPVSSYRTRLEEAELKHHLRGLATSLAGEYDFAARERPHDGEYERHVREQIDDLLANLSGRDVDARIFFYSLERFSLNGVPVRPSVVTDNAGETVVGARQRAGSLEGAEAHTVLSALLARIVKSNVERRTGQAIASEIARVPEQYNQMAADGTDPAQFLENVYSMAIKKFADSYADPTDEQVRAWLEELAERAAAAAQSDAHPDDPSQFLENVYAMAISKLADSYGDPTDQRVQAWLGELAEQAAAAAQSDAHDTDPAPFLSNVYAMVINKLVDSYGGPTDQRVQAWLNQLAEQATDAAQSDAHPDDPSQFLSNVYAMAIKKLVDSYGDPTDQRVQAWLGELADRATTAARSDAHDMDPAPFLSNVYSMVINKLADSYADPTDQRVQAWLGELARRTESAVGGVESLPAPAQFTGKTAAMALGQVTKSREVEQTSEWLAEILEHALDAVDESVLKEFSREFQRMYHVTCAQTDSLPEGLPVFLSELRERTIEAEEPILADRAARIDLLASALADAAFGMWLGDQGFETDPAQQSPRALGAGAPEDTELVVEVLARTDRRLADCEVSEWLLEQADDDPGQQLRDRVLGHGYAAAAAALEDSDDNSPATLADAATVEGERDPTTRLYRAGLQGVRDGEFSLADPVLKLAWLRREHHDPGTEAHRHACAAGVCYAGSLALENDPEMPPAELARQAVDASADLPEVALALHEAVSEGEASVNPDSFTEDIDPDAEPHDIDALEHLEYADILSQLVDPPGPTDYYTAGLGSILNSEPADAARALKIAWESREDTNSLDAERDAVAAGVALLAHTEMDGVEDDIIEQSTLRDAVEDTCEELSPAVEALFDTVTGSGGDHDPDELRPDTDPGDDEFDRDDLEATALAKLVDLRREPTVSEAYTAGLRAVARGETEDGVRAFSVAWESYGETSDPDEQRDAVAAGVSLLACVELDVLDESTLDDPSLGADTVREAVADHREVLSPPVIALFETATQPDVSCEPDSLRPDTEPGDEEFDRDDLEALVCAGTIEAVDADDRPVTAIDDAYTAAVYAIGENEPGGAIRSLETVWRLRDTADRPAELRDVAAAGVALLAHVESGLRDDEIDRDAVVEAVETSREHLPDAVMALYDACIEESTDTDSDDLTADIDRSTGLTREEVERIAFARLLRILRTARTPLKERLTREAETWKQLDEDDPGASAAYDAALLAVEQNEGDSAVEAFTAAWNRHDRATGEQLRDATAAGVALLAHVEIGWADAGAVDRERVLEAVETHRERLPDAVIALHEACVEEQLSIDPDRLTADIHPIPKELTRDELERKALIKVLRKLRSSGESTVTASRAYELGVRAVTESEQKDAVRAFAASWTAREDADGADYRDAVAAGVALLAHVEIGIIDEDFIDRKAVLGTVESTREQLSTPVLALCEACRGDQPRARPNEFVADIDSGEEELDREEAERVALAALLNQLLDEALTATEAYVAGLRASTEGELEDALQAFNAAWERWDDSEGETRYDATAAGVALLAHVKMGVIEAGVVDSTEVTRAVALDRTKLPEAVAAVFDTCVGQPTPEPDELTSEVGSRDESDRKTMEIGVFAGFLRQLKSLQVPLEERLAWEPDEWANLEEDEVTSSQAYEAALLAAVRGNRDTTIEALGAAWESREDGDETDRIDATAAGVALLACIELEMIDPDSVERAAVTQLVALNREALSEIVTAVFDACAGRSPVLDTDEPAAGRRELHRADLEAAVFSTFLEQLPVQMEERPQ